jgi:hypothetical protein
LSFSSVNRLEFNGLLNVTMKMYEWGLSWFISVQIIAYFYTMNHWNDTDIYTIFHEGAGCSIPSVGILYVQQYVQYGDFAHHMLKIDSSNFIMMITQAVYHNNSLSWCPRNICFCSVCCLGWSLKLHYLGWRWLRLV